MLGPRPQAKEKRLKGETQRKPRPFRRGRPAPAPQDGRGDVCPLHSPRSRGCGEGVLGKAQTSCVSCGLASGLQSGSLKAFPSFFLCGRYGPVLFCPLPKQLSALWVLHTTLGTRKAMGMHLCHPQRCEGCKAGAWRRPAPPLPTRLGQWPWVRPTPPADTEALPQAENRPRPQGPPLRLRCGPRGCPAPAWAPGLRSRWPWAEAGAGSGAPGKVSPEVGLAPGSLPPPAVPGLWAP